MWCLQVLPTVSKSLYFYVGLSTVMWSFKANVTFASAPFFINELCLGLMSQLYFKNYFVVRRVDSAGRDI